MIILRRFNMILSPEKAPENAIFKVLVQVGNFSCLTLNEISKISFVQNLLEASVQNWPQEMIQSISVDMLPQI